MNDFDKAVSKVGNRFDLVLIASERMRELHKMRQEQEESKWLTVEQRRKQVIPAVQAVSDIENGTVGREYLSKLKERRRRRTPRFDDLK